MAIIALLRLLVLGVGAVFAGDSCFDSAKCRRLGCKARDLLKKLVLEQKSDSKERNDAALLTSASRLCDTNHEMWCTFGSGVAAEVTELSAINISRWLCHSETPNTNHPTHMPPP